MEHDIKDTFTKTDKTVNSAELISYIFDGTTTKSITLPKSFVLLDSSNKLFYLKILSIMVNLHQVYKYSDIKHTEFAYNHLLPNNGMAFIALNITIPYGYTSPVNSRITSIQYSDTGLIELVITINDLDAPGGKYSHTLSLINWLNLRVFNDDSIRQIPDTLKESIIHAITTTNKTTRKSRPILTKLLNKILRRK